MAAKLTVVPELFTGDKSWDEWIDHFESVADICGWEDENKLKWMRARLSGGAGGVFRRLPDATKADYTQAKEALRKRFEPETRKAHVQTLVLTGLSYNDYYRVWIKVNSQVLHMHHKTEATDRMT